MPWYLRKYFILTLALTAFLLIPPFFTHSGDNTLVKLLFLLLMLSTLYSVAHKKYLLILGIALTVTAQWGTWTTGQSESPVFIIGLISAFILLLIIVIVILRNIVCADEIEVDTIFGGIATYLLIGVTWALLYYIVDVLVPQAFIINTAVQDQTLVLSGESDFGFYNYFSLVTMTSLGYGDIIPAHPVTRALATYQVIAGQMFIAILVARLVGLHLAKS